MSKYPLYQSVTAQFVDDGAGGSVARAQLGPTVYGIDWRVQSIVTTTSSTQTQYGSSQLIVYQGQESPTSQLFGSYSGDNDVASGDEYYVMNLDRLVFVWTKGDIGSFATAIIRGVVEDAR